MRIRTFLLSLAVLIFLDSCDKPILVVEPANMRSSINGVEFFYETVKSKPSEITIRFGVDTDECNDYSVLLDGEIILSPQTDNRQIRTFSNAGDHSVKCIAKFSSPGNQYERLI